MRSYTGNQVVAANTSYGLPTHNYDELELVVYGLGGLGATNISIETFFNAAAVRIVNAFVIGAGNYAYFKFNRRSQVGSLYPLNVGVGAVAAQLPMGQALRFMCTAGAANSAAFEYVGSFRK